MYRKQLYYMRRHQNCMVFEAQWNIFRLGACAQAEILKKNFISYKILWLWSRVRIGNRHLLADKDTECSSKIYENFEQKPYPHIPSSSIYHISILSQIGLKWFIWLTFRDYRIACLCKENEALKNQLTKYMSAIQMLKRDGHPESPPDYKDEAKMYEQKLIQVLK